MPPGLPKALYLLVTPIEFIIKFLVTPFTHTVRLFANLLAGHILLVTFAVLSSALWALKPTLIILPLPVLAAVSPSRRSSCSSASSRPTCSRC